MSAQTGRREPELGGRYELISQIATGPLGPLWVARATTGPEAGRVVFVRRIARGTAVAEPLRDDLRSAALVAADVRHPKIAAVLDTISTDDELSIVSEYIEGEILRGLLRRASARSLPLSTPVALRLGLDLIEAVLGARRAWLEALQANSADHDARLAEAPLGALCADNVLITSYGEAVILDVGLWGTARHHEAVAHHPDAMSHAAPEQLGPEPRWDERSDVFTIGVIVWELLANRPLFAAQNWSRFTAPAEGSFHPSQHPQVASLKRRVLEAPIARLDAVVRAGSRVERTAADFIARALARDPADRYGSLSEMQTALQSYDRLASHEDIGEVVRGLAATSLEARRAALTELLGGAATQGDASLDSARPTVPPDVGPAPRPKAESFHSSSPREEKKLRLPLPSGKPRTALRAEANAPALADPEASGPHTAEPSPEAEASRGSAPKPRRDRKKPPLPPRRKRGGSSQ